MPEFREKKLNSSFWGNPNNKKLSTTEFNKKYAEEWNKLILWTVLSVKQYKIVLNKLLDAAKNNKTIRVKYDEEDNKPILLIQTGILEGGNDACWTLKLYDDKILACIIKDEA